MLPAAYTTPAAAILTLGGLVACFAGYRLFRFVLGIYGFFIGASVATTIMGAASGAWALTVATLAGGLLGALLMVVAYFIGVGLIGAGLATLALNLGWRFVGGEPPTVVLVIVAAVGALTALSVARYVVIVGTAMAGAWTLIVGVLALMGERSLSHPATSMDTWVFHPLDPVPARWWYPVIWVALFVVGAAVQLATTSKGGKSKFKKKGKT